MAARRLLIAGFSVIAALVALPALAGVTDVQNDEFNFRVSFPTGSQVCPAVAFDHPYGFYAWYGQPTACDKPRPDAAVTTPTSTMGVYATYNTTYQRSARTLVSKVCRPDKAEKPTDAKAGPAANSTADSKPEPAADPAVAAKSVLAPATIVDPKTLSGLNFRRYKSVQCATVEPDGSINIDVVTQAGKWVDGNDPGFQTPLINYRATLHTTPDRLSQDLPMFKRFLEKVDIRF
jgi:hypothetical protein